MAYRLQFSKILSKNPLLKPLLMQANADLIRSRAHSQIWPPNPFLNKPSLFSVQVIKKYYETIPIIVFTTVGFTCEVLYTIRNALTRDDVCYGKKMACEDKSNIGENKAPPIRKLLPLFLITGAAVVGLCFAAVRSALTRDDVRYSTKSKMLCEKPENEGPRKFLVFNQKYEPPKAWYEAMEALKEPTTEGETKKQK